MHVKTRRKHRGVAAVMAVAVGTLTPVPVEAARDRVPPEVVHTPCGAYEPGVDYEVVAEIHDDSPLFDPKVIYRSGSEGEWQTTGLEADPDGRTFRAYIPARDLAGPLEYIIETFDQFGNGPTRFGSVDAPNRLLPDDAATPCAQVPSEEAIFTGDPVEAPVQVIAASEPGPTSPPAADPVVTETVDDESAPIYEAWWFWTIIGVVAVGAGVGIGVAAASGGQETPSQVTLTLTTDPPAREQ